MRPLDLDSLKSVLSSIHRKGLPCYPLIVGFFSGRIGAKNCVQMPRSPMPETGIEFGPEFGEAVKGALSINPSIHDGAIAFLRASPSRKYRLEGWSMRIVSQTLPKGAEPNRGSAFNSAVSLSCSGNVDLVCLFTPENVEFFVGGSLQ